MYDSNSVTFWKRQNYAGNKKISGCLGSERREEGISIAQSILRVVKLFCMIL